LKNSKTYLDSLNIFKNPFNWIPFHLFHRHWGDSNIYQLNSNVYDKSCTSNLPLYFILTPPPLFPFHNPLDGHLIIFGINFHIHLSSYFTYILKNHSWAPPLPTPYLLLDLLGHLTTLAFMRAGHAMYLHACMCALPLLFTPLSISLTIFYKTVKTNQMVQPSPAPQPI
jgi:hypothetical protein